jgi:hypothetical protein
MSPQGSHRVMLMALLLLVVRDGRVLTAPVAI